MNNVNNSNENNEKSNTSDYSMEINENKNFLSDFFNAIKNRLTQKRLSSGNNEKHVTNASISSMWSLAQLRASITGTISKGINSVIERFSKQEETKNGFQTEIIGETKEQNSQDKSEHDNEHSVIASPENIIMPQNLTHDKHNIVSQNNPSETHIISPEKKSIINKNNIKRKNLTNIKLETIDTTAIDEKKAQINNEKIQKNSTTKNYNTERDL